MAVVYVGPHKIDVSESAAEIDEMMAKEDVSKLIVDEPDYRWSKNLKSWEIETWQRYRYIELTDAKEGHKLRVPVADIVVWGD